MTEYTVRYLTKTHVPRSYNVVARDVKHAIDQFQELVPDVLMTSVLPADQWTDEKKHSDA